MVSCLVDELSTFASVNHGKIGKNDRLAAARKLSELFSTCTQVILDLKKM